MLLDEAEPSKAPTVLTPSTKLTLYALVNPPPSPTIIIP